MKAIIYDKKNKPDRLVFREVEIPTPKDNEVLIQVFATSVNAADYRSMQMGMIPKSKIFGADVSGVIESVGSKVQKFKVGDPVIGELSDCGFGGFAEFAVAPESAIVLKPKSISFEECASLPLAAITALQALRNKGNIQKDQKVLIVGSSGGVGTYAVQLAKYFGAIVTGVCSKSNLEQAKLLGANEVIDYNLENFSERVGEFDLVIGVNGNYSLSSYRKCLKQNGSFVLVGGALTQIFKTLLFGKLMSLGSKKMSNLFAKSNRDDLEFVTKILQEGKIKPMIEKIFDFEKTVEALIYVEAGHAKGKVAIKIK